MSRTQFIAPNGDSDFDDFSGLYSKGLKQQKEGVALASSADAFVDEITRGKMAVEAVIANPATPRRVGSPPLFEVAGLELGNTAASGRLNGPQGAFTGHVACKESGAFTTLAPPKIGSAPFAVELAELYWASLLRDASYRDYVDPNSRFAGLIAEACDDLTTWAKKGWYLGPVTTNNEVTPALLFRGGIPAGVLRDFKSSGTSAPDPKRYFDGETVGPYVSQLCLAPTMLGAQPIDQRIAVLAPQRDYLIRQQDWLDAQNGKPSPYAADMDATPRHIRNGRDLASFTHVDELYQAYLTAFLVMANSWKMPANPGIPYLNYKNQKAFGAMGGPEISALLGLVAREAIDAVWWQKWAVHLRARPEATGGLVHLWKTGAANPPKAIGAFGGDFDNVLTKSLAASAKRYSRRDATAAKDKIFLLSQAFPEGSPTHPAYPTGHGAVAGACITALKFFFDGTRRILELAEVMVPSDDGRRLEPYEHADQVDMTVNGELHKLAHNISFGHGIHAGIHWRTDTDASMLLGEEVAIDCLNRVVATYTEPVNISITRMNGDTKTFSNA